MSHAHGFYSFIARRNIPFPAKISADCGGKAAFVFGQVLLHAWPMDPVPLIHRSAIVPAIEILDGIGAPTETLLRHHRLPRVEAANPCQYLPVLSVWEFIETASARQGMWDFGFRVAEHVTLPRAARWGRQVASAVTLHNAITIMAQTIGSDMPNVVVGLERRGEESWLWRDHVPDRRHMCGYWLGEQYILGLMIEMLRLVEGQSWYPKRIELQATASQWGGHRPEIIGDALIKFDAPRTALELPAGSLSSRIYKRQSPSASADSWREATGPPTNLMDSVREVVRSLLLEVRPDLCLVAEILRTSERTLRRNLAAESTTWRQIIDGCESEAALDFVAHTNISLNEIASRLHYSQYSHFHRAFRRWTGESPTSYRRSVSGL
jgi:AraC-like DNA-binding protein